MKLETLFEMYTAYVLDGKSRRKLAKQFPPVNPEFVGHHVTSKFGVSPSTPIPQPADVQVVGHAEEDGLEAFVVSVNGKVERPDGSLYHVTWSIDRSKGKKPKDSNALVQKGYSHISPGFPIRTTPEILR